MSSFSFQVLLKLEFGLGLIFRCGELVIQQNTYASCEVVSWDGSFQNESKTYYAATRLLVAAALICMLASAIASVAACIRGSKNVVAPILAILTGVMGCASCATFIAWTEDHTVPYTLMDVTFSLERGWAFYMSAVGSSVILVFGFVYAVASRKRDSYKMFHSDYGHSNNGYVMDSHVRNNSYY